MQMRLLVLPLLATTALAQAPLQLEAVSANLKPDSQQITVTMTNHSTKVAVAWFLELRQFDASGKEVNVPLKAGVDWAGSLAWGDEPNSNFILPGAEGKEQFGAAPEAIGANAAVLAVIYKDRTAEGDPTEIAHFFEGRARRAQHAEAVAELLATYPASSSELRERLGKLAEISERTGAVDQLLKGTSLDRQQWNAAAAEQKRFADGLTALCKEAR
jgi:hypothetical protein